MRSKMVSAHLASSYFTTITTTGLYINFYFILLFQESYYLPKGGDKKNPGGKIYNKVNTIKSKLRKREKCEAIHVKRFKLGNTNDIDRCDDPVDDPVVNEARRWLNINDGPWTTVMDMWRACFPLRRQILTKSIAIVELENFNHWRFIATENGHQLVSNYA